eukprot:698231-Pyramimonas_sp.AAC.1
MAAATTAPGITAAGSCFEHLAKANVNRELILALRIEVVSYLRSTLGQMGFLVQQEGANKACVYMSPSKAHLGHITLA